MIQAYSIKFFNVSMYRDITHLDSIQNFERLSSVCTFPSLYPPNNMVIDTTRHTLDFVSHYLYFTIPASSCSGTIFSIPEEMRSRPSKLRIQRLDKNRANLSSDERIALAVGVDSVARKHGVGHARRARTISYRDGGLGGGVPGCPAGDGGVDGLDSRVAPGCGDHFVDLFFHIQSQINPQLKPICPR